MASVSGTKEYETWVGVDEDGALDFFCTCPYDWGACKHAVAVILAGLALVKTGETIPLADPDDERCLLANDDFSEGEEGYDDEYGQSLETGAAIQTILQKKKNRHGGRDREVAEAVAASHPEVALDIWYKPALHQIGQVKPAAYEVAATYLGKMRRVYQQTQQMAEWQKLILSIRTEHKRKRRLLEILDSMAGKRIID